MDHQDDNLFFVSVKGLFFNSDEKLLMVRERNGRWECPGGRMQKGETFSEALRRECKEEMGLECRLLEKEPSVVYPTIDGKGRPRIMVFFKITFENLNFKPSEECEEIGFFTKHEIDLLSSYPQLKPLLHFI